MDFKLVLDKLLTAFEKADIGYALMGGFGLGLMGVHRATVDPIWFTENNERIKREIL